MKACEHFIDNHEIKMIGHTPLWSNEYGIKLGWRAALEWVSQQNTVGCNDGFACWLKMKVDEELNDDSSINN